MIDLLPYTTATQTSQGEVASAQITLNFQKGQKSPEAKVNTLTADGKSSITTHALYDQYYFFPYL